ncbi:MAG TPA: DUF2169 domain-containing protein [Deltaproteobacteria bacterium]|nr:DUF2169 domain-containing protein [Deltaproteobacteria bacterium]HOM29961.1 DUF2169 domain-containing protein [Deltaproteobacteria bacterium]HPP81234.1 DUF2169 domain-containing protein [Deltaproteobacteria bacterium]
MPVLTSPAPCAMQLSGRDPQGGFILSVVLKVAYAVGKDGSLEPMPEQEPLNTRPVADGSVKGLLVHDIDIYPYKLSTDVVIKGHAYGHGRRRFIAGVSVAGREKRVLVVGDRSCTLDPAGKIVFSEPEPVDKVPLSYTHAYGGRDHAAERTRGNPFLALHGAVDPGECDLDMASPFLYPRNPCGTGYLIEKDGRAVEALRLPNLEDPQDPLTPERLCVQDHLRWPLMPLPQAMDWYDYGWFPRIACAGIVPDHDEAAAVFAEVDRGLVPAWVVKDRTVDAHGAFLLASGASPGLSVPYLVGGEEILLGNMHPGRETMRIRLPKKAPRLFADARNGRLNRTDVVMHTVVIEPDRDRVCIVWRGSAPALRPYLPQELAGMPFMAEWP